MRTTMGGLRWGGLIALSATAVAGAQVPAVHPLGPVIAQTEAVFLSPTPVRQLSDGRVMINDGRRRIVLLYDAGLRNLRIVIDSVAGRANSYGSGGNGVLIAAPGDTTLFLDPTSQSLLVLDPRGTIVRVEPFSGNAQVVRIEGGGVTASLGLIYRGEGPTPKPSGQPDTRVSVVSYSASPLVAMNVATHVIDTLARVAIGGVVRFTIDATGRGGPPVVTSRIVNPVYMFFDPWAVMTDGTVGIVRGREYRVEWINPDRTVTQSGRIPYPWQRIDDAEKARLVDSVNGAQKPAPAPGVPTGGAARPVLGASVTMASIMGPAEASLVPDFRPAIVRPPNLRAVMADADNNLWVSTLRTGKTTNTVYDVINRKGELIDIIVLPEGRGLIGFGAGGLVYVSGIDGGKTFIETHRR